MDILTLKIAERGELIEQLTAQLAERGITDAAVVSIVGAVRTATLATMKADDPKTTIYSEHKYAEVNGVGEVKSGTPNLHVTLGLEAGEARSGHLQSAIVGGPYFVNVYVAG